MIDLALAQDMLDAAVGPVVDELLTVEPALPPVMLLGAVCRDALHMAGGHTTPLRRTDDLDLALAVDGWDHFTSVTSRLRAIGAGSTIRFDVASRAVDLVPFGGLESPDGLVAPPRRGDPMSVFGFQDVAAGAHEVRLTGSMKVRVPTVPGYTVLKLKAWADRSAYHEHKDGADLATAAFWYQRDRDVNDRLYGGDADGLRALEAAQFSEPEAALRLLVADARAILSRERRHELAAVWQEVDDAVLAEHLGNPLLVGWPGRGDARLATYARAIREQLGA